MSRTKLHLYEPLFERQEGVCACGCGQPLYAGDLSHMNEIDRIKEGGEYSLENCRLLRRECHLRRHGNDSAPTFPALRAAYDNRMFWMKERRRLAKLIQDVGKSVWASDVTAEVLEQQLAVCKEQEKRWTKRMIEELRALDLPIAKAALSVHGIGEVAVAFLLAMTDIRKAKGPRSLWQHLGIGDPSQRNPGRGEYRAQLYLLSSGQLKANGPYRWKYDAAKARHELNGKKNAHYAALRETAKEIVKDFWRAYRFCEGLPTTGEGMQHLSAYGWGIET